MIHSSASKRTLRPRLRVLGAVVTAIVLTTAGVSVAFTPAGHTALVSVSRIDSGGPGFTDLRGQLWSADSGATGGEAVTTTESINGAWDQELFRTQRVGMSSYRLDAPAGEYELRMYFAALGAPGAVFGVTTDGQPLLTGVDIAGEVGTLTAEVKQLHVTVGNDGLTLDFTGDGAAVAGLELLESKRVAAAPGAPLPELLDISTADVDAFAGEPDSVSEETLAGTGVTGSGGDTTDQFTGSGGDWVTEEELGDLGRSSTTGTSTAADPFDTSDGDWVTEEELGGTTSRPVANTGTSTTGTPDRFGDTSDGDWVTEEELGGGAATVDGEGDAGDPFLGQGNDWVTEEELGGPATSTATPTAAANEARAVRKTTSNGGVSAFRMRGTGTSAIDAAGRTWRADTGEGGYLMEMPVGGLPVFAGMRTGATGYRLPVLNGPYSLEMSFGADSEGFDATVEGTDVISDFPRSPDGPTTMTVDVVVVDGVLDIEFGNGRADVLGIELIMDDNGTTTDTNIAAETAPTATSTSAPAPAPATSVKPPHGHAAGTPAHDD